ncbi:MAG: D-alanyl-D-alanine carboxypeptidase/D-alanyl-D-alanine endopeptidase, partial [Myxococcales bacterium]
MNRGLVIPLIALFALAAPAWAQEPGAAAVAQAQRKADREALRKAIDGIIEQTVLSQSRVGLQVVSLDDGSVVYARNADELLNPASNVKLFTTAAALARLGPEFRFDTEFLVDDQAKARRPRKGQSPGDIRGNLYVRGKGDPSITTEKMWGLANELYFAGLRSVSGNLVLDDSYFDGDRIGPGFDQEDSDRAYMAPTGALSLNWNAVGVYIGPGETAGAPAVVELDPPSDFFVVENRVTTTRSRSLRRLWVSSVAAGDKQRIIVSGRVPVGSSPVAVWRKIDNPALYFGHTLKQLLAARGIRVRGKVVAGAVPDGAQPFMLHQSETLDLVLKRVNKVSSNFTAEQLVKAMGAQVSGAPGTWAKGIQAIEEFLATEVGMRLGTFVMKNGSGLNDTNRFSAAQICRLLRYMWLRFPLAPEFLSSLGIAAKDGTLHYRMEGTDAAGRLRAKTGTLENVSALSGYVQAVAGERFAFSVVANDFPGRASPVISAIDALGAALAGFGEAPDSALAQTAGPEEQLGPLADLKARMAIYEKLAQARDPRNVTFLRTALKTERDPALKAIVAEAVYRSSPNDSSSVRALVENFDSGAEVFGRLRQLARDLASATPVLGSLTEVAGEGDADALGRFVEVAALARSDEGLMR